MEDETPVLLPAAIPLHLAGLLLSGHHRPGPGPLRRLMEGVYTETARASCSILSLLPASWTCLSDSCLSACSLNLLCLLSTTSLFIFILIMASSLLASVVVLSFHQTIKLFSQCQYNLGRHMTN